MNRFLLLTFVAVLVGCPKNPSANAPDGNTEPPPAESRTSTENAPGAQPAPSPAHDAPPPAADSDTVGADADQTETVPLNGAPSTGGRLAKPGWCDKDEDCSAGKVCEKCGEEGQCVPGCHNSSQCAEGEYCNQVQCIRCPCPGICESKTP